MLRYNLTHNGSGWTVEDIGIVDAVQAVLADDGGRYEIVGGPGAWDLLYASSASRALGDTPFGSTAPTEDAAWDDIAEQVARRDSWMGEWSLDEIVRADNLEAMARYLAEGHCAVVVGEDGFVVKKVDGMADALEDAILNHDPRHRVIDLEEAVKRGDIQEV